MGRRFVAAVGPTARCSPSSRMARVLLPCTVSRTELVLPHLATVTEHYPLPDCFYRATPCMGRHCLAAVGAPAQCSPSTPMALALRACIVSRIFMCPIIPTATEVVLMPD